MIRLSREELEQRARRALKATALTIDDPAPRPSRARARGGRQRGVAACVVAATAVLALLLVNMQREPKSNVTTTSPGGIPSDAPSVIEETTTSMTAPAMTASPTTTLAPATTAPRSVAPSTTRQRSTTTTAATTTTVAIRPDQAALRITNSYPAAMDIKVNGTSYRVAAGKTVGPFGVTPASDGNDTLYIGRVDNPSCGAANADTYFRDRGEHVLRIEVGATSGCSNGEPSPAGWLDPGNRPV